MDQKFCKIGREIYYWAKNQPISYVNVPFAHYKFSKHREHSRSSNKGGWKTKVSNFTFFVF